MAGLKQAGRGGKLTTALGTDVLVLAQVEVTEALSELFVITIDAVSEKDDIDFNRIIGTACTVEISAAQGAKRHFSGLLVAAETFGRAFGGDDGKNAGDHHNYRLTLRPWLWVLGKVSDCRIFHKKTVIDILKKVFSDRGFKDYLDATTGTYPTIEYCVQYRETDLDFACRLMEHFGIYYFFKHSDGLHTLVLADATSSHKKVEGMSALHFHPLDTPSRHDRQCVIDWVSGRRLRSGKVVLNDYNFETPTANMLAKKDRVEQHTQGDKEIYDYPGRYPTLSEGEDIAKAQVEAQQAQDRRRTGAGLAPSLVPGGLVSLERHPRGAENVEFLVLRCRHKYQEQSYRTAGAQGTGLPYTGTYEFLPSDTRFRPPVVTPRPIVHGPQTAVVTGQKGEEIDVDKYGRILVRFHWDRDKGQSCRVRVAQIWSGKSWGGQVIPRIGQEVVVEFLEGDPDRPLVTGTVYNADNMLPYTLPDNKTMSGVKSNSTKGGGGYNEFMFEDKKGSENIRMHAQKDHEVVILNSETVKIGERFASGGASREHTLLLGDDKLTVATGNQSITIAQKQDSKIGMSRQTLLGMSDTLTVGMSKTDTIGMSHAETAGVSIALTSGATISITAGAGVQITAAANIAITAPMITLTGIVKVTGPLFTTGVPIPLPA
jgi:type VI secretion system secreted protein VgrG